MTGHYELVEHPGWEIYYLMDLRTRKVLGRYDEEEELLNEIADIEMNNKVLSENLEVLKAINTKFVRHAGA